MILEPTRAAALARLDAFSPRMGRRYAAERNHDHGSAGAWPANVSMLSPYLRHRLIDEQEVLARALDKHGPDAAEKFVSEVLWRGYFRGWLEQRPAVWDRYLAERDAALAAVEANGGLARDYRAAIEGRTGIDCFDAWADELTAHNWLHNHARMWFASIWIFTLRLPWVLGADFFLRHLLDGDAASNTLSWRWVAGLHTRGKAYAARADNIARYTGGRFNPKGLVEEVEPLTEDEEAPLIRFTPPPRPEPAGEWSLLLHEGDLAIGHSLATPPSAIVALVPREERVAPAVAAFRRGAVEDAATRAGASYGCPVHRVEDAATLGDIRAGRLVAAYVPLGNAPALPQVDTFVRDYDAAVWPLATAGFFKVKAGAPAKSRALGLPL
ncbi:hypothetical protein COC42_15705 [Sphingomonas spermidinifaciens]|uniref:Cryptochrome/DNA photolyase FAD-binding domain-containing protein n=1 Tax=Sphingomonas spermidinifaciens TaxID=1141889 RepID=A0A2A4B0V0_9SPHN|nr:FAD-binding domain-containing protein [Sphingomonas spermidinifaciens]PCD01575.1 hypothetical protein COC42_15705 [Sphingomonas spermidinifaciens]